MYGDPNSKLAQMLSPKYPNIPSAEAASSAELKEHMADNAAHVPHLGTTTNSGNTYSVTSTKVIADGSKFSVKFNAAATGTATLNVSSDGTARILKKPDGTDFKPKAGIYSFIRDGVNFQLLGEGGEYGTAVAGDVRSTKTIGTDNGVIQGTLDLSNLTAENIKAGVTIDGVAGSIIPANPPIAGTGTAFNNSTLVTKPPTSTVFVKAKETRVKYAGSYGVSVDIRPTVDDSSMLYVSVYVNGVSRYVLYQNTYSFTTKKTLSTSNIGDVNANDLIQIYARHQGYPLEVSNFKLLIGVQENSLWGESLS